MSYKKLLLGYAEGGSELSDAVQKVAFSVPRRWMRHTKDISLRQGGRSGFPFRFSNKLAPKRVKLRLSLLLYRALVKFVFANSARAPRTCVAAFRAQ